MPWIGRAESQNDRSVRSRDGLAVHGPDEYVEIPEVVTAARALALIALHICGVA